MCMPLFIHSFIHSYKPPMSGRRLSVRRMHQLPIQSLHPHRAYTLVGDTEKKVVNLYTLSVQRIITTEQGRGWGTTEERLWLAFFLRKWPLVRHLNNVQKWDVHVGSGVNGPGRGNGRMTSQWVMVCSIHRRHTMWLELREQGGSKWRRSGRDQEGPDHWPWWWIHFILCVMEAKTCRFGT